MNDETEHGADATAAETSHDGRAGPRPGDRGWSPRVFNLITESKLSPAELEDVLRHGAEMAALLAGAQLPDMLDVEVLKARADAQQLFVAEPLFQRTREKSRRAIGASLSDSQRADASRAIVAAVRVQAASWPLAVLVGRIVRLQEGPFVLRDLEHAAARGGWSPAASRP